MKRAFVYLLAITLVLLLTTVSFLNGFGQTSSRRFLSHLQGEWQMKGTVMGKPVEYAADGVWVLHSQFLYFHMKDVAIPPRYEANLSIGIDSLKNQYVAHWLDVFGGAGARVVGFGPLSAEKIEIMYPYPAGRFRNLFNYNSQKDAWTLVIESEGEHGHWSLFAQYSIVRKR
jgi:hypothetical protein